MLKSLPDDIVVLSIFNYIDAYDLISYLVVSKYFHNYNKTFKKIIKTKINNEKEKFIRIKELYHKNIIDIMGGVKYMTKLPYLEWKKKYLGGTGYIEGIKPTDMSSPVMLGFDEIFDRPFISFRSTIKKSKHIKEQKRNDIIYTKRKYNITTLFQRYSNSKGTWSNSSYNWGFVNEGGHFMTNGIIRHELLAINICNLLNNNGYLILHSGIIGEEMKKIDNYYLE